MVWRWLGEENARLLLLAGLLLAYMSAGALLFQFLEEEPEPVLATYLKLIPNITEEQADLLHSLISNTTRPKWDYAGSFHFAATIVSTIGYGSSTPNTPAGRVAVIVYGFLGCSGGILFFNLFLERIISLLALFLGYLHVRKLQKAGTNMDDEDPLEDWKPNVYLVLVCLTIGSVLVAIIASCIYTAYEGWTFLESLYFCFVSFSTIGFGDYVSTQQEPDSNFTLYRLGNFTFLAIGCCFIYSLFNVTSIVIKQALNWMLIRLDCHNCGRASDKATKMLRRHSLKIQHRTRRRSSFALPKTIRKKSDSGVSTTDSSGRRLSGEISMKELMIGNKVSLAVMQKQLYETAMMQRGYYNTQEETMTSRFTPGMVGPLAIISQKLESSSS
ncbi:potassium channel subfamily K member 12-like [Cimex lectularius]|uniref:Potassium channel domain-containing protein n=1 Tax=Cimex lectularius TaxID=79782 RepID=A0A8I6S9I7_CIMLE|nr:potassium channel subfamily K member 12-like [Cimex lectularius]